MDPSSAPVVPVSVPVHAHNGSNVGSFTHPQDAAFFPNSSSPQGLPRGRQAKNPNSRTFKYDVTGLDDLSQFLREYLEKPPVPADQIEFCECQFHFWIGASFVVTAPDQPASSSNNNDDNNSAPDRTQTAQQQHAIQLDGSSTAPPGYQAANPLQPQYGAHTYQSIADPSIALALPPYSAPASSSPQQGPAKRAPPQISMNIQEALQPTEDPKDKMKKQRSIAKACIDAIQTVDGFRYSFHNCWNSREDDAFRFSYYCNDSLLNKDRAANGKGAKLGKRATKPVYDCKGVLSVKFSATKQTLDVFYKHVPCHETYEARAPPPRRDSKRRKHLEHNDPEALIRIANRPRSQPADGPRPKKKKIKKPHVLTPSANSIESDLRSESLQSLLDLIRPDPESHEMAALNGVDPTLPNPPTPVTNVAPQFQPPQVRRRPQVSCDICKAKKTRCDGARPVCNTCTERGRQCNYSKADEDRRQSLTQAAQAPVDDAVRQAQAASSEMSETERLRRELEEAKALIKQLQSGQRTSSPPQPTPRTAQPGPSQSQPRSQPQPQSQAQSRAQMQTQSRSPQQADPQSQQPQPSQQSQQLQQPPQQLHNSQQLQLPQYSTFNHPNSTVYNVNRNATIDFNKVTPQDTSVPVPSQMQASGTGLTPAQEFGRDFWSTPQFQYPYPAPPQQDQWQNPRYLNR